MSQPAPAELASIDRGSRWPMRIFIIAAVLIAFGASTGNQFVEWDDQELITGNRNFNPPTLAGLMNHWAGPDHEMYIPVVYTAWWTLAHVPGPISPSHLPQLNPIAFHAANVIVHLLASLVVFEILFELVGKSWAACAGAVLFAVHPLQTESVAWATGMKDVLSGMLALVTVWQYILARRDKSPPRYFIATACFVLALLAKPSTVCVPIICALVDWLILRTEWKSILKWLAPWLVPAIAIVFIAAKVQPVASSLQIPIWERPLVAADALSWYLTKFAMPIGLAVDYSRTPTQVLNGGTIQYACLALAVVVTGVALSRKRVYIASSLIFVVALLPVLGFTSFAFQRYSTVADRYAYLALLGPAIAVAAMLSMLPRRKWHIAGGIVALALIVLSIRQTLVWHDTLSLFSHTLEVNPTSLAATRSLGFYWAERNDDAQAVAYYEAANQAHPEDPSNHFNYANLLRRHGAYDGALEHYRQAIAAEPNAVKFRLNYGVALIETGQIQPAMDAFQGILDIDHDNVDAYLNLGLLFEQSGAIETARRAFTRVLELDPSRDVARRHLAGLPATRPAP